MSPSRTANILRSSIGSRGKSFLVLVAAMTAWSGSLRAENLTNGNVPLTMDGGNSTYLFDAYTKEWGSITALIIGNSSSNNAFTLQNGAVSNAVASGSVGLSLGKTAISSGNSLTVIGAGTSLSILGTNTSRGSVAIGELGSGNSVTVSGGASITSYGTTIGTGRSDNSAYGSNNSILITGTNTSWTATGLSVGSSGSSNSLTLSAGAQLTSDGGTVGGGQSANTAFGSNNTLLVTGVGTHWEAVTGSGRVTTGSHGLNNTFTLSAGATLNTVQFYIGSGNTSTLGGGSFNTVTLDGAGTAANATAQIRVGASGNDNNLTISNGARLTGGTLDEVIAHIGLGTGSRTDLGNRNTATVTGAGSAWEYGALMVVGEYGSENRLRVLDGGKVSIVDLAVGAQAETVAGVTNGSNNSVVVSGENSQLVGTGSATIGIAGNSGNKLTLLDHGLAKFGDHEADTFSIATGNYLQIDGGFLALFGDQTSLLASLVAAGTMQVERNGVWETATATADFEYQYFAPDADTSGFTGGAYSDLGGYTVVTATASVPEPRSAALLALGACFLGIHWRRRTWRTKSLAISRQ